MSLTLVQWAEVIGIGLLVLAFVVSVIIKHREDAKFNEWQKGREALGISSRPYSGSIRRTPAKPSSRGLRDFDTTLDSVSDYSGGGCGGGD